MNNRNEIDTIEELVKLTFPDYDPDIDDYVDIVDIVLSEGKLIAERRASWDNIKGNDYVVAIYELGGHRLIWVDDQYDPELVVLEHSNQTPEEIIRDIIEDWEHEETDLEWMLAWGYDDVLDAAIVPDDYDDTVNVLRIGNYYGCDTYTIIRDDDDIDAPIREWPNAKAARKWIDEQESGTYMLAHGEAGIPSYRIIKAQ